ncbi:Ribosomal biogenesis protein [Nymphaea thermarum]|nr:Ribosomal biogenesis protein [Nymphaea thermarum]
MNEADREGVSQVNAEEASSSGYRLVPWQSWEEWNMIREKLLSSSPESVLVALNRIKAWESRGCLPIPVAITAEMVEARLTDPYFRKDVPNSGSNSEKMLSLLYSMAIMRLVNGFVDQSQHSTKKRLSIAKAAEEIGLPRMLIDIRHESSHRGLPSLQLLRLAIDKALNWLQDYYWERQVKAMLDIFKDINSSLCKMAQCIKVKKVKVKKEVHKASRSIILAYSSYSMEVATLLLEKCWSCKFSLSDSSKFISTVVPTEDDMLYLADLDAWKLVIKKLSRKRIDLLLVMFKAAMDKIDAFLSQNTEDDVQCDLFMPCQKQSHEIIENIASLASWLLECLKELVYSDSLNAGHSGVNDLVLRDTLEDLLLVCLGKLVSTNSMLNSCLILSDLVGRGYLTKLIRRLTQMGQSNQTVVEIDKKLGFEPDDASINEAVKKLDMLKKYRLEGKVNLVHKEDVVWTVAKSWRPCPIGMLPSLGSAGRLPMLDKASKVPACPEAIRTSCKRHASHELQDLGLRSNKKRESREDRLSETLVEFETDEFVHDESQLHESKMTTEGGSPEKSLSPLKGKLLIDGYLQHCGPDILHAIQSKVSIFDSSS